MRDLGQCGASERAQAFASVSGGSGSIFFINASCALCHSRVPSAHSPDWQAEQDS